MKTRALCLLALLCVLPVFAHAAPPAVSVSINPSTGVFPYPATITWTASGASTCVASDGWSGSKALTGGSQLVTVSAATKYTLTCTANDGSTTTTWTPPTTRTDGSSLTDLAGFNVYRGTSLTNIARVKSLGPTVLTYSDANLAPGNYYYLITSVDSLSQESTQAKSTPYPVAVVASTMAASASASGPPAPPSSPGSVTTVSVSTQTNVTVSTGP